MNHSPEAIALQSARDALDAATLTAKRAAVRDVRMGMPKQDAAARHGISRPTLNAAIREMTGVPTDLL